MSEKRNITGRDHCRLSREIEQLETRLRQKQAQSGETADTGGNQWHDNAGYDNLVIEIRGLNKQLEDLHEARNHATVVSLPASNEKIVLGTDIVLERLGETERWSIVGFDRGDFDKGLLAYNTPLARQIIGMRAGEARNVKIGGGTVPVKIVSISITPELEDGGV